ncbi:hypothetical protein KIPB_010091 [Kipferlia bialata]|uniref:Uncharacterized protein n=1 Tax=Kipferlia bialata TaxID=797122 RepID=A0A391NWA3_9EUKA|nr:hypothetical protein KIPB_010091 [Kipferlia bialata]|eukprot:g10091.t1
MDLWTDGQIRAMGCGGNRVAAQALQAVMAQPTDTRYGTAEAKALRAWIKRSGEGPAPVSGGASASVGGKEESECKDTPRKEARDTAPSEEDTPTDTQVQRQVQKQADPAREGEGSGDLGPAVSPSPQVVKQVQRTVSVFSFDATQPSTSLGRVQRVAPDTHTDTDFDNW